MGGIGNDFLGEIFMKLGGRPLPLEVADMALQPLLDADGTEEEAAEGTISFSLAAKGKGPKAGSTQAIADKAQYVGQATQCPL